MFRDYLDGNSTLAQFFLTITEDFTWIFHFFSIHSFYCVDSEYEA